MMIYKIFRDNEWSQLHEDGESSGAPIDVTDGYVHFSTARQVEETAAKHFAGEDKLWLLGLETDRLEPDLKWEKSRGGQDFPHLYRKLKLEDISWAQPLPVQDGLHQFPPGLT